MTRKIIFVTDDLELHRFIREKNESALGPDQRSIAGSKVSVHSFHYDSLSQFSDVERYISRVSEKSSGIIVIATPSMRERLSKLADTCFICEFFEERGLKSFQNYVGRILARCIRLYKSILDKSKYGRYIKVLLLPIDNFEGDDFAALVETCSNPMGVDNFPQALADEIEEILLRQKPKNTRSANKTFLVDDDGKYFEYGLERHAECETGKPHTHLCRLKKYFRFGIGFDDRRHFNVSRDGASVKGEKFANCHEVGVRATRESHINMFPGGYFT